MKTNILNLAIVLTVGVILAGSLLMPVITDAQETAGAVITKSNADQVTYGEYGQYWDENITFVLSSPAGASTVDDATITVNDEQISMRTGFNRHIVLTSDNLVIEINTHTSNGNAALVYYPTDEGSNVELGVPLGNTVTAEYNKSAGTIRLIYETGNIDLTFNATYCFTVSNNPDYAYINASSEFARMYMSNELIKSKLGGVIEVFSTTITIGETPVLVVLVSDAGGTRALYDKSVYAGDIKVELVFDNLQVAEGTTDIFTGGTPSFKITADGETVNPDSIVPSRSFIISEVTGHEAGGAAYTLYGIIPVMVIVALLMVAVGGLYLRRSD